MSIYESMANTLFLCLLAGSGYLWLGIISRIFRGEHPIPSTESGSFLSTRNSWMIIAAYFLSQLLAMGIFYGCMAAIAAARGERQLPEFDNPAKWAVQITCLSNGLFILMGLVILHRFRGSPVETEPESFLTSHEHSEMQMDNEGELDAYVLPPDDTPTEVSFDESDDPDIEPGSEVIQPDWRVDVSSGAIGFVASALPVYMVQALIYWLSDEPKKQALLEMLESKPDLLMFIWAGAAAVIFAPFAEELLFRVCIQGTLERKFGAGLAIVTSAFIFAVMHGWPFLLAIFPLGLILGYVYHRRRSWLAVAVMHVLFNGFNLAMAGTQLFALVGSVR